MAQNNGPAIDRLARVIETRARQFPLRVLTAAVICGLYFGYTGPVLATVWFISYVVLQLIERAIFSKVEPRIFLSGQSNYRATLALLGVNTLLFGAFGVAEAVSGGPWGLICACLLWAGAVMNSVVTCNGSRDAFLFQAAPSAVFCLATPFLMLTAAAPWIDAAAVTFASALNLAVAASVWISSHKLSLAETSARAELQREKQQAEAATAAKSAFVAMVSHELRTPISAIMAGASVIERTAKDASLKSSGLLIGDSARLMRTLLNDLLDLSKIEAGHMGVETIVFDLRSVIADTVRFWSKEATGKGLKLRLAGSHRLPQWVEGDPTRLRQILNNLLSNACKFTDQGSITVALDAIVSPTASVALGISVQDSGPGITSDQLSRLFEAFQQLQISTARTHGGTGLGLAISRELARLMGGDLTAASVKGQGAAFTLALPLSLADAPPKTLPGGAALEINEAAVLRSDLSGPPLRVLIADDHAVNRRAFSLMLQAAGVETTLAEEGARALEILATQRFDVVLMDVNMPGMGGLEAVERLRAGSSPNARAPVIALTASGGADDVRACLAAGMNAFVTKPVESAELLGAIDAVLGGAQDLAEMAVAV